MKTKFILVAAAVVALLSACSGECKKTELFNGQDLSGWVGFVDPESGLRVVLLSNATYHHSDYSAVQKLREEFHNAVADDLLHYFLKN